MERNDFVVGWANPPFYGAVNKAIESLYESKSQLEIATALAARLGFSEYAQETDDRWLRELTKPTQITNYDAFKKQGIQKIELPGPYVAFANEIADPKHYPFATPSGKIEIYSQQIAELNNPSIPPIPKYIPTWEGPSDPLIKKYPLQLVSTHSKRRAHSQFENVPWLRELVEQALSINIEDARDRGIRDGDMVKVFNDRGATIVPAKVTERIMPGVVDLPQGAWYDPDENGIDRGGCANVLTKDQPSPGAAFTGNTALVQVEKV